MRTPDGLREAIRLADLDIPAVDIPARLVELLPTVPDDMRVGLYEAVRLAAPHTQRHDKAVDDLKLIADLSEIKQHIEQMPYAPRRSA